jgi:hypothetical protein
MLYQQVSLRIQKVTPPPSPPIPKSSGIFKQMLIVTRYCLILKKLEGGLELSLYRETKYL